MDTNVVEATAEVVKSLSPEAIDMLNNIAQYQVPILVLLIIFVIVLVSK